MPRILFSILWIGLLFLWDARPVLAQESPASPSTTQPQVKVNMLNVCSPTAEEQKEIAAALARVPKQPLFGSDFEVTRGRSTLTDMPSFLQAGQGSHVAGEPSVASYVRIRREFSVQALFSSVQYSFSNDGQNMVETLVLHVRDPKDLIQVSLEDSASAVASSEAMLGSNTPATRVRLERFGKSSVALARCLAAEAGPAPDQSAYEPLFRSASEVMANYRGLLSVKTTVPEELAKISGISKAKPSPMNKMKPHVAAREKP
ncbi:MAG: hypothetical protein DMG79_21525 [Acidobacteria bacterium]|nr:MAG: hypothetical protein DMG79_21525 [Acidobacteriota bacterium]